MKDIYEMFNDIEVDEKEFEEMPVSEIEKERVKKNIKEALSKEKLITKKRFISKKKISIAAAITMIFISSAIVVNPALATSVPIIGELFKRDLVSVNGKYSNYLDVIGKTKSCEGIDVTFESAVADNNMLFLNFVVKNNNKEIKDNYSDALLIPTEMKVNGKSVSTGAGASWEFIDNNTIRILKKIDWSKDKLPNKMNIDINISHLFGKTGDWGVHFFLDKSKQTEKTYEEKINSKLEIGGEKGEISTVTISPLTVTIKGKGKFDDISNVTVFDFIVLDDKGNELCWNGSSRYTNGLLGTPIWSSTFISNNDMKSVTIIPIYETKASEKTEKLPAVKVDVNNVKPMELTIDKDRSVSIKDYFIDGEYLIVRCDEKYFGKERFRQRFHIPIYVKIDGAEVNEGWGDKENELCRKYHNFNDNVQVFKIGTSRNIMIGTYDGSNVKILKDKSFTVKMKK